jgi:hypothetical protein
MAKIAIFIPSRIYGGAERQMALLAIQACDDGHDVTLIDSRIGVVSKMTESKTNIKQLVYDGKNRIDLNDFIVITQASYAFCLSSMLNLDRCDLRFWFMHPLNLPHMYLSKRFENSVGKKIKKFWYKTYRKKIESLKTSMYFQSLDTCETVSDFYNVDILANYTGLLSENRPVKLRSVNDLLKLPIELCWLGRLDNGSKLLVLKKILTDWAQSYHFSNTSCFHVIGDGPAKQQIMEFAEELNIEHKIQFHGHVAYEHLPTILIRCLVVFAHGTSVYEGVLCRAAVCLVDFYLNQSQVNRMKYRLFSDSPDLTLGFIINGDDDPQIGVGQTFDNLLNSLHSPEKLETVANYQLSKFESARTEGKENSTKLYTEPYEYNYRNERMPLDVVFFAFRNLLLRVKKQVV